MLTDNFLVKLTTLLPEPFYLGVHKSLVDYLVCRVSHSISTTNSLSATLHPLANSSVSSLDRCRSTFWTIFSEDSSSGDYLARLPASRPPLDKDVISGHPVTEWVGARRVIDPTPTDSWDVRRTRQNNPSALSSLCFDSRAHVLTARSRPRGEFLCN